MLRPALLGLLMLLVPASAQAAPLTTPCGGRALTPDKVITGEFGTDLNKSYVMLPFDVPKGTTAVRVKYCWDRPESGTSTSSATSAGRSTRVTGRSYSGAGTGCARNVNCPLRVSFAVFTVRWSQPVTRASSEIAR